MPQVGYMVQRGRLNYFNYLRLAVIILKYGERCVLPSQGCIFSCKYRETQFSGFCGLSLGGELLGSGCNFGS